MMLSKQKIYDVFSYAIFVSIFIMAFPAVAAIDSQGPAWHELESRVDGKIEAVMRDNNIPGMTVAVSKNGRLVLKKGSD